MNELPEYPQQYAALFKKLTSWEPDQSEPVAVIDFVNDEGHVSIAGQIINTWIYSTEMSPFWDMLDFADTVLSGHDPAFMAIDPEGPEVYFITSRAASAELVKIAVCSEAAPDRIVMAILSRRQLAQCFMLACERQLSALQVSAETDVAFRKGVQNLTEHIVKLRSLLG